MVINFAGIALDIVSVTFMSDDHIIVVYRSHTDKQELRSTSICQLEFEMLCTKKEAKLHV